AFCLIAAAGKRLGKHARRYLPRHAPPIFAPTARTLLAATADDSIPVPVSLLLIVGGDLEREGFIMFERGAAVETNTCDAGDREFHYKYVARLARRVIARRATDSAYRAIRKGLGVEAGSSFGVLLVPEANRVLSHCVSSSLDFSSIQQKRRRSVPAHNSQFP